MAAAERRGRRRRDRGRRPRVSMRLATAELVDSREILPGSGSSRTTRRRSRAGSRAGQFVHVRTGDFSGLVLRRPFSFNTVDPATGHRHDPLPGDRPGHRLVHPAAAGRHASTCSARSAGRSRSIRAAATCCSIAGGLGIAGVRMLADEAIRDGRQVVLLFGAATAAEVYPSTLLPDEVEYVVATDDGSLGHRGFVTELVPDYEAWADQAFACGPAPMLAALARLAAGRRERLGVAKLGRKRGGGKADPVGSPAARRKAFLQVSMEQNMGCAVGACLGCVVMGASGQPQRVCREGPVFAAEEIDWEAGW